ncbi:unnamed protein product [Orchesella dallaii]|uniref:Uncharacterized protein n=1 Tax=Orchesella dallaii TaxID=48710 RepID=A0ABP1QWS0_9HEXA
MGELLIVDGAMFSSTSTIYTMKSLDSECGSDYHSTLGDRQRVKGHLLSQDNVRSDSNGVGLLVSMWATELMDKDCELWLRNYGRKTVDNESKLGLLHKYFLLQVAIGIWYYEGNYDIACLETYFGNLTDRPTNQPTTTPIFM